MSNFTDNAANAVALECDSSRSSGPDSSSSSSACVGPESNDAGAAAGSHQPHNPYHGVELCSPDIAVTITAEAELISARQVRVRLGYFAVRRTARQQYTEYIRVDS